MLGVSGYESEINLFSTFTAEIFERKVQTVVLFSIIPAAFQSVAKIILNTTEESNEPSKSATSLSWKIERRVAGTRTVRGTSDVVVVVTDSTLQNKT